MARTSWLCPGGGGPGASSRGRQSRQPSGPLGLLRSHRKKGDTQHPAATSTLRTMTEWMDTHTDLGRCAVPASGALRGARPAACTQAENSPTVGHPLGDRAERGSPASAGPTQPSLPWAHVSQGQGLGGALLWFQHPQRHSQDAWRLHMGKVWSLPWENQDIVALIRRNVACWLRD